MTEKRVVSVRLAPELLERLDAAAHDLVVGRSFIMTSALEGWLDFHGYDPPFEAQPNPQKISAEWLDHIQQIKSREDPGFVMYLDDDQHVHSLVRTYGYRFRRGFIRKVIWERCWDCDHKKELTE